jgi:hypothetical protein
VSTLSLVSLKTAFMAVLTSNSALLAALGAGASSVILKQALRAPQPRAPFIAVAFGGMSGGREDVRTLFPTLWLYDDDPYAWTRLNSLAALIEAALTQDSIAYCYTNYAGGIGDEITDTALQRPALAMRYQVRGRF